MKLSRWLNLVDATAVISSACLILDQLDVEKLDECDREDFRKLLNDLEKMRDELKTTVTDGSRMLDHVADW